MPSSFPDIAQSLENRLLVDEDYMVSSSNVTRVWGAADVSHCQTNVESKVMKVWAKPKESQYMGGENQMCYWCDIKGHTIQECRKKKEHNKAKSAGSSQAKSGSGSKLVKVTEIEAEEANVVFEPWDDPKVITVSPVAIYPESSIAVFDTGATHSVFNDRCQFITF